MSPNFFSGELVIASICTKEGSHKDPFLGETLIYTFVGHARKDEGEEEKRKIGRESERERE